MVLAPRAIAYRHRYARQPTPSSPRSWRRSSSSAAPPILTGAFRVGYEVAWQLTAAACDDGWQPGSRHGGHSGARDSILHRPSGGAPPASPQSIAPVSRVRCRPSAEWPAPLGMQGTRVGDAIASSGCLRRQFVGSSSSSSNQDERPAEFVWMESCRCHPLCSQELPVATTACS